MFRPRAASASLAVSRLPFKRSLLAKHPRNSPPDESVSFYAR
jgi:hypothetical protein